MSISVTLPDDLATRLAEEARRRRVTADELAVTLLSKDLPERREIPDRPHLRSLIAIGASDGTRSAADIDGIMAAEAFGR